MADEQAKREELIRQIASLPTGSLTKKTVKGREYWYLRVKEDGKRRELYVPRDEVESLREQLALRKRLEQELVKGGQREVPPRVEAFEGSVLVGDELREFAAPVASFKKRALYGKLRAFLEREPRDKVLVLCGLRRTGKTTLIRQAILDLSSDELARAAFMQVTPFDTLAQVNRDLRKLAERGYRTVFVDEVTLLSDFVEGAALFSDVFATRGMHLVLSGTDSLGFVFAESEQLYDRCTLLRTTFIPYREFEEVLGVEGVDEYLRYGGTMSLGGRNYNEQSTFASKGSTDEYIDSAIARNIQHSLKCYQDGGHFRSLQELYDSDELTSAINRVVEDVNHRFTLDVLSRDFKSHDLALSARNLRQDRKEPTDILDRVDIEAITRRLRDLLEIRDAAERTVELSEGHVAEIREYLALLDLVASVSVVSMENLNDRRFRTIISQPGLRYAQAEALVESLLADDEFSDLSLIERDRVLERIRSEIMRRMMEDLVLLETALAFPRKQIFVLQFPVGEFDMVVFDPDAAHCEIYEVKHSAKAAPQQYRFLVEDGKCAQTEHRFGPIVAKRVLYRGKSFNEGEVEYVNVEEYLRNLPGAGEDRVL